MPNINLYQKSVNKLIDYLSKEGDKLIKKAAASKDTKNDTQNQLDAYGWCVYYDGHKKAQGFLTPNRTAERMRNGWSRKGIPQGYGRDDVIAFFDSYKPESRGFILVCVNAVFYSTIQEAGYAQKKYRIISQIAGDMQNIASKFKGSKVYTTL